MERDHCSYLRQEIYVGIYRNVPCNIPSPCTIHVIDTPWNLSGPLRSSSGQIRSYLQTVPIKISSALVDSVISIMAY